MVEVRYDSHFKKKISKIKDSSLKNQVLKQIEKIVINPEIGKPMKFERKGTREVYIKPFRLVYSYDKEILVILFLDLYHKKEQ
ncbi:MAG: type II toxin-antitoxin system RelE family toxin [Candidatus Nanoarchaeia archaeon]